MEFTNLSVNWDELPQVHAVELRPIQPVYLKVLWITWIIIFSVLLLGAAAAIYLIPQLQQWQWIGLITLFLIIVSLATVIIGTGSFKRKGYAIRQRDILYRTGWVFQDLHVVPYNRIQHCVVNSGPVERRFGLASLSLYTAASEVKDITLHGLLKEEAEQLKEWILQQIQPVAAAHEL